MSAIIRFTSHSTMIPMATIQGKNLLHSLRTSCLDTLLKALDMSTLNTTKPSLSQLSSMHFLKLCTFFSAPGLQASQIAMVERNQRFCSSRCNMHFPVSLRSVSPTKMGLISGGDPSFYRLPRMLIQM